MDMLKSVVRNLGVLLVGVGVALVGRRLDRLLGIPAFSSPMTTTLGALLLAAGFLLRAWTTVHFYKHQMRVISVVPQHALITGGPYRFSRNPLYLGGNGFIFFGAALVLGSPSALYLTAIHLPLVDLLIRREERQLEQRFGRDWVRYKEQVRRWI